VKTYNDLSTVNLSCGFPFEPGDIICIKGIDSDEYYKYDEKTRNLHQIKENEMKLYEVVIWTLDADGERSDEFTYKQQPAESAKDAEHAVLFDMNIREANTVDVEVREFHPLA